VCTDDTGRWGTKGIFASINSRWPKVAEEFARQTPAMGTCMHVKVGDDEYLGKQYVAVVVGQKVLNFMAPPEFNLKSFETAIAALSSLAQHKQCSVHMARLSNTIPKMEWDKVEKVLMKYLVSKGIPTYIYSLLPVTPQPPKEKKKKKESTKKGKKADDDEDDEDDAPPSKGKKSDKSSDKKSDKKPDKKSDEKGEKKSSGKDASISPYFKQASEDKKPSNQEKRKEIDSGPTKEATKKLKKLRIEEPDPVTKQPLRTTFYELPSVFRGKVIYVHPSTEDQRQMERYVIAYDGTTESSLGDDVTHIVVPPDTSDSEVQEFVSEHPAVHVVNPQWAWDCINTVKLQDEAAYMLLIAG